MEQEYKGSCHCGSVQYKVMADVENAMTCNCSMCERAGTILTFVPENAFELKSGQEHLSDYQFNKKTVHHLFCKNCGIKSFGWGTSAEGNKMYAINIRCLEGVDIEKLNPKKVNGKDF